MPLPTTMRAIRKLRGQAGLDFCTIPVPACGPRDVLIRVRITGICGTDLHIYNWDAWSQNRIKPPLTTGHEFVGDIVALGAEVHGLSLGQRVSAEGHITCGQCRLCRTGRGHICRTFKGVGVDREGCFADYIAVPAQNVWPVPAGVPDMFAAIYDPLGNAMHTVMSAPVSLKNVLVMGAGAIGLFAVSIAKVAGAANVIVVEPNATRIDLARKAGADLVLNPRTDDVPALVRRATNNEGPEVVLEMSGNAKAMQQAFSLVATGGTMCLLGIPSTPVDINWAEDIMFKGITMHGITGRRMFETWFQVDEFLLHHSARLAASVTHTMPCAAYEEAFALMNAGACGKINLTWA